MAERAFAYHKRSEAKTSSSVFNKPEKPFKTSFATPYDQIMYLQRTIGSQSVRRLLESGVLQAKQITHSQRQID